MNKNREWLRTGSQLMILSLLSEHDSYGYEIIQALEVRSDHVFTMKEGTLYPILHRMEEKGYVKAYMQMSDSGRARKYYTLTDKGRRQLVEDKKGWEQFSTSVEQVVSGRKLTYDR